MNKAHNTALIEDPDKEPLFAELAELVAAGTGIHGIDAHKERYRFPVPPPGWFPPPANDLKDSVEAPSPDESG
jgi:hypothetical protein